MNQSGEASMQVGITRNELVILCNVLGEVLGGADVVLFAPVERYANNNSVWFLGYAQ